MLGGVAEITNTSKSIEKVLEMSGITRIIPIIQNSKSKLRRYKMKSRYDNEMELQFVSKSRNEAFCSYYSSSICCTIRPYN